MSELLMLMLSLVLGGAETEPFHLEVLADPVMGMEAGVRDVGSVEAVFSVATDALARRFTLDESRWSGKVLGVASRLATMALIELPLAELLATFEHEVFGHGARRREFGDWPSYQFRIPFPYSLLEPAHDYSGLTVYVREARGSAERLMGAAGGLEAEHFAAYWIEARALREDEVSVGRLLHYGLARVSYFERLLDPHPLGSLSGTAGDLDQYEQGLHRQFNLDDTSGGRLSQMVTRSMLASLIDPFFWRSLWDGVVGHLWFGARHVQPLRFTIGQFWWFVGTRFNLTPFGPEHTLDVFIGHDQALLDVYLRVGTSGLASYFGAGARMFDVSLTPSLSLGGEIHAWSQPLLLFEYRGAFDAPQSFGFSAAVEAEWHPLGRLGLVARFGAKSRGVLMGQPAGEGVFGFAGVSFR